MNKRIITILVVLALGLSLLSAAPFRFVFGDLGQHAEIIGGFLPSYFMGGVGYSGLSFHEGDKTELQLLLGAGYNQRKLWQDPYSGEVLSYNPIVYDVIDADWALRLAQGFGDSPAGDKDFLTITLGYEGQYEKAVDSIATGKLRSNGGFCYVESLKGYGVGEGYSGTIHPELSGDGQFLGTQISLSFRLDGMSDTIHENDGYLVKAAVKWGPKALNSTLNGYADYLALSTDFINAITLFSLDEGDDALFSVVLIDRLNLSYVLGDAIPAFIEGPNSLGRKVRGFNTYTYNTAFSVVNNLDLRFAGPFIGLEGLAPRVNLFFDLGYGCGSIKNVEIEESNLLSSAGIQATATIFDFIDLGYQLAYLIKGNNYVHGPESRLIGSVTFFLDF